MMKTNLFIGNLEVISKNVIYKVKYCDYFVKLNLRFMVHRNVKYIDKLYHIEDFI